MINLGICTAFKQTYLVLFDENGNTLDEKTLPSSCKQSENCLPAIDELLTKNNTSVKHLGTICVVSGPGSFTGIRIGLAIVKAFITAYPSINVVCINTLKLLACTAKQSKNLPDALVCINALSGNYFVYSENENATEIDSQMVSESEFVALLKTHKNVFCDEEDKAFFGKIAEPVAYEKYFKSYALELIKNNEFKKQNEIEPVYLRLSQAEAELLKKEADENN